MNIDKILSPKEGVLQINSGRATAEILDAELDVLQCSFNNDLCVKIDAKDYKYIVLTQSNLMKLLNLIEESDDYYQTS